MTHEDGYCSLGIRDLTLHQFDRSAIDLWWGMNLSRYIKRVSDLHNEVYQKQSFRNHTINLGSQLSLTKMTNKRGKILWHLAEALIMLSFSATLCALKADAAPVTSNINVTV